MGLLRKAIVLGGILYLLPSPPATENVAGEPSVQASTMATLYAATETVADAKSFCERRPQVCVTGYYIYSKAEAKAKYSAKLAYEWYNQPAQPTLVVAHSKPGQAPLRLATLNDPKPTTINDLLRASEE
ncbi:MAG TPA: DUF5330 domain-containing protein [Aestuariivirga sp.]